MKDLSKEAGKIGSAAGCEKIYHVSATGIGKSTLFMARRNGKKCLLVFAPGRTGTKIISKFSGEQTENSSGLIKVCPLSPDNASALREVCDFTNPAPVGKKTSFGFGDRLGNATAGHARVAKRYKITPVFAQQSMREMTRTNRSPQQVMDDAAWGVFQEHYTSPFGADADHLKTVDDIKITHEAGFTMFTADPSEKINNNADKMSSSELDSAYGALFKTKKESESLLKKYAGRKFKGLKFSFTETEFKKTAVKYLPALRHVAGMYEYLEKIKKGGKFDFEISIDETDLPTSPKDHLFIISCLQDFGVKATSLAPRFIGEFQKAIDYIGDPDEFTRQLKEHYEIASAYGGYKISIHSGSDKFSIFPIVGKVTKGRFHEKTAGTSYLEAIRTIALKSPQFYREIHKFALKRFENDRASYHVTTDLGAIPNVDSLPNERLKNLFDDNNARQLIHITYGSVLQVRDEKDRDLVKQRIMQLLDENEEEYFNLLDKHFTRHLESFGAAKISTR